MLCPKNIVRLNTYKEHGWRQNKGQNALYIMYNSDCYKESQEFRQNQNVNWDKSGRVGTTSS